jgi:hypothetical protein
VRRGEQKRGVDERYCMRFNKLNGRKMYNVECELVWDNFTILHIGKCLVSLLQRIISIKLSLPLLCLSSTNSPTLASPVASSGSWKRRHSAAG